MKRTIWSIRRNYRYYRERIFRIVMHMRQKISKKIVIHKSFHVNHHLTFPIGSIFLSRWSKSGVSQSDIRSTLYQCIVDQSNLSKILRLTLIRLLPGLFRTTFVYYHTRSIRRNHSRILENVDWTQLSLCRTIAHSSRSKSLVIDSGGRIRSFYSSVLSGLCELLSQWTRSHDENQFDKFNQITSKRNFRR